MGYTILQARGAAISSTLSDIIGTLISLSNGSQKKRTDYLADRTTNPKNTTRDTPSQLHHQHLGHMCPDIHQGVEIHLRSLQVTLGQTLLGLISSHMN